MEADFSGWASKAGMKCADGRIIHGEAFKDQHQQKVPLVWAHKHDDPSNVLGYAILEHRAEGVYTYGFFNDGVRAGAAKMLLEHGDVDSMSIWANNLVENGENVLHGVIREVSLVLAGANPGAKIENVHLQHGDSIITLDEEAIITTGEAVEFKHAATTAEAPAPSTKSDDKSETKTVKDIIENMSEEEQAAVAYVVAKATGELDEESTEDKSEVEHAADGDENITGDASATDDENIQHSQEGTSMTHNVFEGDAAGKAAGTKPSLSHDDMKSIVDRARQTGSFKTALVEHLEHAGTFGINEIDELFPNAKNIRNTPDWIDGRYEWVDGIINGASHVPFSRIRSMSADITHEEARAKGYIKGNLKKDEFFGIKSRVTTPATIYKKQKLDRDDIIDITEFDVVVWLKAEMRRKLEQEIARAILLGDGRDSEDEDKVKDPSSLNDGAGIRSIAHDHDFYAHQVELSLSDEGSEPAEVMEAVLRSRKAYRGTGNPAFFTTEDMLTDMLLSKDGVGRRHFKSVEDVAAEMRVSKVVVVDAMEEDPTLIGIMVNMSDYTVGTDNGGKIGSFEDFDIDYNQFKYLIETRFAGALTKYKSAVVFRRASADAVTPGTPTAAGNVVTIPSTSGVTYYIGSKKVTGTYTLTKNETVHAEANEGRYIPESATSEWTFTYTP